MKRTILAAMLLLGWPITAAGAGYDELNVAIDYYNQGAWADAIEWSTRALAANDLLPDQRRVAYVDRALSRFRLGRYSDAIDDGIAAIAIKPDDLIALTVRADAYLAGSQFKEATADLGIIYLKEPDNAQIGFELGPTSWWIDNYNEAGAAFSRVVKQYPSAWLWWQLANVRGGKPVSPIVDGKFDQNLWPNPLKQLYAGSLDAQAVLQIAGSAAGDAEICDADFYVGEWRLAHGEMSAGKPLVQRAAEICLRGTTEKNMAIFEVHKLAEKPK